MILTQVYILVLTVVIGCIHGGKHQKLRLLTNAQRMRFHAIWLGVYCLLCLPMYLLSGFLFLIPALLIRVGFFDISYNAAAGLPITYIGDGKEWAEKLNISLFGKHGGLIKTGVVTLLLIMLNIIL